MPSEGSPWLSEWLGLVREWRHKTTLNLPCVFPSDWIDDVYTMPGIIPTLAVLFSLAPISCGGRTSGFYADNGLQQTLMLKKLRERERRVMRQEILQLLGLHNQPKPLAHVRRNSAPQFMLGLYETLQHTDQNAMENSLNHNLLHVNMSGGLMKNLGIADTITSFINHGKRLSDYTVTCLFNRDYTVTCLFICDLYRDMFVYLWLYRDSLYSIE